MTFHSRRARAQHMAQPMSGHQDARGAMPDCFSPCGLVAGPNRRAVSRLHRSCEGVFAGCCRG
eukprot:955036-Pyramimonas_sp.AAC.1